MQFRIGNGYDIHRLTEDRKLILGGVEIPYHLGLLGHSDADVLTHALMDALLGALNLGDIGKHFPPSDMKYKDADSLELLKHVMKLVKEKGYSINNVDCVVQAEKPKLLNYIPQISRKLAEVMNTDLEQVSVKATTMEKLGDIGKGHGIAAYAVVLLVKN